ncbi:transcription factor bHLH94-like isoform X2 [Populus nigra]|uniref:transcription factor bHLH94-like isoform X2 n=1 Tax=Populus nigra TaxID=3691 RepID=UPI002B269C1E|nr:transcription factor bHLH94-like isoform X2 [Populus nigra]XP_061971275.1 transcription factor bHLH94-like isoform X2 [Populus nigra]
MALEAAVFQQDWFGHSSKELYNLLGGNWSYDFGLEQNEEDQDNSCSSYFLENQTETFLHDDWNSFQPPNSMVPHLNDLHLTCSNNIPSSSDASIDAANGLLSTAPPTSDHHHHLGDSSTMPATRVKRRRSRSKKNKEEIENQRMTHIAVERNRRKQMNEYLSVLRALMPESYVQRGDQASIIGGAINFVKELEQKMQVLGACKKMKENSDGDNQQHVSSLPFSEFFTFPQYSTSSIHFENSVGKNEKLHKTQSTIADIEVTMVESHANLKIRSKRRPKQLLKVVSGLHSMRLTVLHLNVTTVDQIVLYSLSVKVEDDCKLTSVDEIATAVYQMLDGQKIARVQMRNSNI